MKLPQKIEPCPILDALVEIRFKPKINRDAVFGLLYNSLKSDFRKVDTLPIMQLPDQVRASDPQFKFKPHYRLSGKDIVVQIGPDVISISSFPEYIGWKAFSTEIYNILNKIQKVDIIDSIVRVGIRYINFFSGDVYDNINLKVLLNNKIIDYQNTIIRTEIKQGDFNSTLQIANNAENKGKAGSVIDIDTFVKGNIDDFFNRKKDIIENGHEKEKALFFSLLTEKFLQKLNPEY
ncbi:MAG: TIGR04255 family protein [Bacteroidales bacterium]